MAAIVSRVGQQGLGRSSARKNRVARVSAKAAQRSSPRPGDDQADRDADTEVVAADVEGDGETASAAAVERKRSDNATYLSMYFRDMALLDVLRPEEEFTSAREIEALEIMLWEAVLAHAPAVEHVLAAIEPLAPLPGEAKLLRGAA
jgi:hypothetical protein